MPQFFSDHVCDGAVRQRIVNLRRQRRLKLRTVFLECAGGVKHHLQLLAQIRQHHAIGPHDAGCSQLLLALLHLHQFAGNPVGFFSQG